MTAAVKVKGPLEILREPFDPSVVKWRVGPTNKEKTKGRALAYVDARDVMERFDAAFGPFGWEDKYEVLPDGGAVEATITVHSWDRIDPADKVSVSKVDVGYPNDPGNPNEKEALKAAYSDAFKRAAVKWGVGRDLYEMPDLWIELDPSGKYFRGPLPVYVAGKGWQVSASSGNSGARASTASSKTDGGNAQQSAQPSADVSAVPSITEPQRKRIKAALSAAKINGEKLTIPQAKAAVKVSSGKESTSELTAEEASLLIERLADQKFIDSLSEVVAVG